jgi:hypothetical protein
MIGVLSRRIEIFNMVYITNNSPLLFIKKLNNTFNIASTKNSPYSLQVRAIDYAANNLVKVALPAFLSTVIFLAFWNLDNADSVPFPKMESSEL